MNIGIIDVSVAPVEADSIETRAIGGSETWLLQITREFARNHKVDVYCAIKEPYESGNIRYLPIYNIIDYFREHPFYDFVILNRIIYRFNTDFLALIRQYGVTDAVYLQIHDISLTYNNHTITEQELKTITFDDPRFRGFVLLTPWHEKNFLNQYPILNKYPHTIIPNGVDSMLIPEVTGERDHRILWSSCAYRGLDILINDVYPIVKAAIPDFGIDVAKYNDDSKVDPGDKDVRMLGNLTKKQLYAEMMKHRCWYYPGTFAETFCITMLENMLCGNIVVSPFTYGTSSMIPGSMQLFRTPVIDRNDRAKAIEAAAKAIITAINDYDNYSGHIEDVRSYCGRYTWANSVESYITGYMGDIGFFPTTGENRHIQNVVFTEDATGHESDAATLFINIDDDGRTRYERRRDAWLMLKNQGYTFDNVIYGDEWYKPYINDGHGVHDVISTIGTCSVDIHGHMIPLYRIIDEDRFIISGGLADRIYSTRWHIPDNPALCTSYILDELTIPDLRYINIK